MHTRRDTIAGVGVDVVLPAQGVAPANRHRVLLNLHGGAFLWGAHSGALVESIPIASLGRIEVLGVDYRQGPEYAYPAASVDVEKVYRELLKTHQTFDRRATDADDDRRYRAADAECDRGDHPHRHVGSAPSHLVRSRSPRYRLGSRCAHRGPRPASVWVNNSRRSGSASMT